MPDGDIVTGTEAPASIIPSIKSAVADKVASQVSTIRERIIQKGADAELDKRTTATQKVYDELLNMNKELQKLKPDQQKYDGQGKLVEEFYSKDVAEKRKNLIEKITKYERALNQAFDLTSPSFDAVLKLN